MFPVTNFSLVTQLKVKVVQGALIIFEADPFLLNSIYYIQSNLQL